MISLHVITMNRANDILRLVSTAREYVDNIRVCDGGSSDNTIDVCKAYNCEVYKRKWDEDYSAQDNLLLSKAKYGEWILLMDDDEIPSQPLLKNLGILTGGDNDMVRMPALDCLDDILAEPLDMYIERCKQGHDRFYKDWLFKYKPGVKSYGSPHRGWITPGWKAINSPYPYIHYKTSDSYVFNDCIHSFINPNGQGFSEQEGFELHQHCKRNGIKSSHDILPRLMCKVDDSFANWMLEYADEDRPISRWFFTYFYTYHPDWLFQFTDAAYWTQKTALKHYLWVKRGFSDGQIINMRLHPTLKQWLLQAGIKNVKELEIENFAAVSY